MMKFRILHTALLCACCLLLAACSSDASLPVAEEGTPFFISFTIITHTSSRADEPASPDEADGSDDSSPAFTERVGALPENWLDIHDIRYAIFDEEGNFIADLTPETSIRAVNDDFTIYEVTARVTAPYFQEHVNDYINFYVLVIANYTPWGLSLGDLNAGVSLADFFHSAFSMSVIPDTSRLLAAPDAEDSLPFPMAGLQYFSINGLNLINTNPSEPFDLSLNALGKNVNMLRALAKIEVIDKINLLDNAVFDESLDSDPLRISGASLEGFFDRGTILPAFSQWHVSNPMGPDYAATAQVEAPTIPANATYLLPPPLADNDHSITPSPDLSGYSLPLEYDAVATALRADKCRVFSCYTFEYSRAALAAMTPAVAATQYPYIKVSLRGSDIDADKSVPVTIPFRIPDYPAGDFSSAITPIASLLRNHIYRYEITGVSHLLRFSWTVCPMDRLSAEIIFK